MKKIMTVLAVFLFIPSISSAAALTSQQANSLIAVVQSSPSTPASVFVPLITSFSNITVNQAANLIGVIQAAPGIPASAFVNLLTSFTVDVAATPAASTQLNNQTQDLSVAVSIKSDSIKTLNEIISSYNYLYSLQASDISNMDSVLSALTNVNGQMAGDLKDLTLARITQVWNQRSPISSIIAKAQSDLAQLNSEPLSWFLNYQTPTDTYSALNAFQGVAATYVADYNNYSAILKTASTPIAVPRSTSCTVQSLGGGVATINCY